MHRNIAPELTHLGAGWSICEPDIIPLGPAANPSRKALLDASIEVVTGILVAWIVGNI